MKANEASKYESVDIILTKEKFPIMFEKKAQEFMAQGCANREEAERMVEGMTIELELYYEPNIGMWGVESEAVESIAYGTEIRNPYTGEIMEEADNEVND